MAGCLRCYITSFIWFYYLEFIKLKQKKPSVINCHSWETFDRQIMPFQYTACYFYLYSTYSKLFHFYFHFNTLSCVFILFYKIMCQLSCFLLWENLSKSMLIVNTVRIKFSSKSNNCQISVLVVYETLERKKTWSAIIF